MGKTLTSGHLQKIAELTNNGALQNLINLYLGAGDGVVVPLLCNQNQMGYFRKEHFMSVGRHMKIKESKVRPVSSSSGQPLMVSLNCGAFGLDSLHEIKTDDYFAKKLHFFDWIKELKDEVLFFHLQDFPNDQEIIDNLNRNGFEIFWWPNSFFSESSFPREDTGLATIINKNLDVAQDLKLEYAGVSFHDGAFPDYEHVMKRSAMDALHIGSTMYLTFSAPGVSYVLANHYQSGFSDKDLRLKNAQVSAKHFSEASLRATHTRDDQKVISRWTGGFNPYGINTGYAKWGLPVLPYAFRKNLLQAVFSRLLPKFWDTNGYRNFANEKEVVELNEALKRYNLNNYKGAKQPSMVIKSHLFAPYILHWFFKYIDIPFELDMVIAPVTEYVGVYSSMEPSGNWDHSTLFLTL